VDERLVELLGIYSLSEREARIFIFLTKNGSCGAGELAKAVGIRRMEAYRLLKRLLDRGIVVSTAGKPIKYQAESLDGVLSLLSDEQKSYVRRMDEAKAELVGLWKQIPRAPKESFEQRFRIIQGREQIYSSIAKMAEVASASMELVLTRNDVVQSHILGIVDKLAEASRRGVKIQVIAPIDPSTLEAVKALAKSTDLRHSEDASRSRLMVADGSQTLVSLVLDDSKGMKNDRDIAIWTDSRDYAETMTSLYRVSFAKAEEGAEKIAYVEGMAKSGEKISNMVDIVRTALAETGWKVEAQGSIRGVSGADYQFAALLTGPNRQKMGVDVILGRKGSPATEKITASALKKLDLGEASIIIIADPPADEQSRGLANLLGVTVTDGSDLVDAAAAVRDLIAEVA
jgi:sugar-specific transcriptional regulator TrmB